MTQVEQLLRHQALDTAVRRLAPGLQADADEVLDSRSFHRAIEGLDPTASGYDDAVRAAVRSVAAAPALPAVPAAAAPPAPAPAPGRPLTLDDLSRLGHREVADLAHAGKLTHLGFGGKKPGRR